MAGNAGKGRPTLRTPAMLKKIEEAASLGCSVEEIACFSGVHKDTIYDWMKIDKDFSDRIHELRQIPFIDARRTIAKAIKESPQWSFEYMKRKKKDEFSERHEQTGKDGEALTITTINYADSNPMPRP